jgi:hypothetical protein
MIYEVQTHRSHVHLVKRRKQACRCCINIHIENAGVHILVSSLNDAPKVEIYVTDVVYKAGCT